MTRIEAVAKVLFTFSLANSAINQRKASIEVIEILDTLDVSETEIVVATDTLNRLMDKL
jgi:hypothetical protein